MNERIVEILRTGNDQKDLPRVVSSLRELDDIPPYPSSPSLQFGRFGLWSGCGERVLHTCESHA